MTYTAPAYSDVRAQPCTECQARPGQPCTGRGGEERKAHHQTRVNAATQAGTRDHRPYDDNTIPNPDPYRHAIHPDEGKRIAYRACIDELRRRGHPLPEQRASELLKHWMP